MFAVRIIRNTSKLSQITTYNTKFRTFLSPAYYCNEIWEQRLSDPIIKNVNIDVYYNELDQRYQKIGNISAVDVDIFANTVNDKVHVEELLDLIHKLRLSADTGNTLESTHHAVIRYLLNANETNHLLQILDDRLNYGIFLDHYTANLLLDTFWKRKDYASGAKIGSQLMLQEDFTHPLNTALSLLHCYNFLLKPEGWPEAPVAEEPAEEVKVRVKYLRNPYYDDHFDLKEPVKIVGKTLTLATKPLKDTVDKSLHLMGLAAWEKHNKVYDLIETFKQNNDKLLEDAVKLIPDSNETKTKILTLPTEPGDLQKILQDRAKQAEQVISEKDIAEQCDRYAQWAKEREIVLEKQNKRYLNAKRLDNVKEIQKSLEEREKLLWYFENEDKIELEIEAKKVYYPKRWFGKKKKPKQVDEGYVPPEVKQAKV